MSVKTITRFPLGQVVSTPGALHKYGSELLSIKLARHARGDWGDMDAEDIAANNAALLHEGRLFSSYNMGKGEKLWIITEWDRSVTTFLLPSEY